MLQKQKKRTRQKENKKKDSHRQRNKVRARPKTFNRANLKNFPIKRTKSSDEKRGEKIKKIRGKSGLIEDVRIAPGEDCNLGSFEGRAWK